MLEKTLTMASEGEDCQGVPSTQASSAIVYGWVIIFGWEINFDKPFSMHSIKDFEDSNSFPSEYITGQLSDDARRQRYRIEIAPGRSSSIFTKIQEGSF